MDILTEFLIVAFGLFLLNIGANLLVEGASTIAKNLGVQPFLVGITIVAAGTSAPEFVVSLIAVVQNLEGMSMGNIVGSNIANIGLILGLTAVLGPITVERQVLKWDLKILGGVTIALIVLAYDGEMSRYNGLILLAGAVWFFWNTIKRGMKREKPKHETRIRKRDWSKNIFFFFAGLALLIISSRLIVNHSIPIMKWLGVSDAVIGLTIVAIGTSLPELAASIASVLKKELEIGVGNIIGSNVLNTLVVLGGVASIRSIHYEQDFMNVQLLIQFTMTLMLYPLFKNKFIKDQKLNQRVVGGALLAIYIFFLFYSFLSSGGKVV